MTTNTTKGHEANSDMAIDPPSTSEARPGVGVSHAASRPDLEARIKARRTELVGKLGEHRSDMHLDAVEAGDRVKAKLSELAQIIKAGVVDGWTSLGDDVKRKLERWLADAERQFPSQSAPAKTRQS